MVPCVHCGMSDPSIGPQPPGLWYCFKIHLGGSTMAALLSCATVQGSLRAVAGSAAIVSRLHLLSGTFCTETRTPSIRQLNAGMHGPAPMECVAIMSRILPGILPIFFFVVLWSFARSSIDMQPSVQTQGRCLYKDRLLTDPPSIPAASRGLPLFSPCSFILFLMWQRTAFGAP